MIKDTLRYPGRLMAEAYVQPVVGKRDNSYGSDVSDMGLASEFFFPYATISAGAGALTAILAETTREQFIQGLPINGPLFATALTGLIFLLVTGAGGIKLTKADRYLRQQKKQTQQGKGL